MENFEATAYSLVCVASGNEFEDSGWVLEDGQCGEPSLVRTIYGNKKLTVRHNSY